MCYKLIIDGVEREYYFVFVCWFKKYFQILCVGIFSIFFVWDGNNFELRLCNFFLLVYRIYSFFIGGFVYFNNVKFMVVCFIF